MRFGGFVSYTSHLHRTFSVGGYVPSLYKIGKKTEAKKRNFNGHVKYQNVSLLDAINIASSQPTIIVAAYWKQYSEPIRQLLKQNAHLVLHDPTEYDSNLLKCVQRYKTKVISIRACNVDNLAELQVPSVYIPHPYDPIKIGKVEKKHHAIALSRIDFDKHTEIIAKANEKLDISNRVAIYGEVNRLYAYHKLAEATPQWEENYYGRFPLEWDSAVKKTASAEYVVDMSVIAKDGGGTQYTFLEAWNGGADLILNKKWVDNVPDTPVKNAALFASDEHELAEILRGKGKETQKKRLKSAKDLLKKHAPVIILPEYERLLGAT